MKQIKQKLELAIYGYEPNQFLPIFYDGRLDNRLEFALYKAKRLITKFK